MKIGLIGDKTKKQLMKNLCVAYAHILKKHDLYATEVTGKLIENFTNLSINKLKTGTINGLSDFQIMIEQNELDALIYLLDPEMEYSPTRSFHKVFRACDIYCIPYATNLGTAEILLLGIENGDLEWRNLYN